MVSTRSRDIPYVYYLCVCMYVLWYLYIRPHVCIRYYNWIKILSAGLSISFLTVIVVVAVSRGESRGVTRMKKGESKRERELIKQKWFPAESHARTCNMYTPLHVIIRYTLHRCYAIDMCFFLPRTRQILIFFLTENLTLLVAYLFR